MMHNSSKIRSLLLTCTIMWLTLVSSQSFAAPTIVTYCGPADCGVSQGIVGETINPSCRDTNTFTPAWNYYSIWNSGGVEWWCMDLSINSTDPGKCGWPYDQTTMINGSYNRCAAWNMSLWEPQTNNNPVDGLCGPANQQLFSTAPTSSTPWLCSPGTPSYLTGVAWVWLWSCNNTPFTISVVGTSVSANSQCNSRKSATCGSANGQTYADQPTTNLCNVGWTQNMQGNPTNGWDWNCVQWASEASCHAAKWTEWQPACGSANNNEFTNAPTTNLCNIGTPTALEPLGATEGVYGIWGWTWGCVVGTQKAICKASQSPAQCGSADGLYMSNQPTAWQLCVTGTPIGPIEINIDDNNPELWKVWKWGCSISGTNQIEDDESPFYQECKAYQESTPPANAQCGTANGQSTSSAPSTQAELCTVGVASQVLGQINNETEGPWSWTCTKATANGSQTVSCTTSCTEETLYEAPVVCDINDPNLAWVCYTPTDSAATFIVTNNKVGINTMDPEYDLDVNGTMRAAQVLVLSDERAKEHIEVIENALEKIRAINGYTFTWKKDGHPDMWVLAQEIEKVFTEAVRTDTNGIKTVQYNSLIAPIIQAINELNSMIDIQLEKAHKQANDITILEKKVK